MKAEQVKLAVETLTEVLEQTIGSICTGIKDFAFQ